MVFLSILKYYRMHNHSFHWISQTAAKPVNSSVIRTKIDISSEKDEYSMKTKKYDVALSTRNFEIELFWKRSLFFWGFIASSFVGYASVLKDKPSLAIVIACFGFVCSVAWSFVNRGSKRWQENWEIFVEEFENEITGSLFKEKREKETKHLWLSSRKFSVSKLTIALSDFTVLIWAALMLYHLLSLYLPNLVLSKSVLIHVAIIGTFVFAGLMLWCGRSSD